jgi:oligopeptide transport system permease protein
MGPFIARRFLWMLLVLFVVSLVTFFLMRAVPGGPFDRERELPAGIIQNLEIRFGLDQPLYVQYLKYISAIVFPTVTESGPVTSTAEDYLFNIDLPGGEYTLRWMNFGPSLINRTLSVTSIIRDKMPASAYVGIASVVVSLIVGLPAGIISALRRNSMLDYISMAIATIGISITVITLGPILQYIFGLEIPRIIHETFNISLREAQNYSFPISGWGEFKDVVLPAFALGFGQAALIARLVRASILQVLNEDYIRTARAKGLTERRVIWLHVLKNSMIPVVTVLGPLIAGLITGSFVTESIFAIPGIGRAFVESISNRDYTLIMGTTLLFSFLLVVANTLVDISYAWLDPRIRYN